MKTINIRMIPVVAAAMILGACGKDIKKPGTIYMPDMTYSNAYETYSSSEVNNPDGANMSARKPVAGTIPYGWIPNDPVVKTNEAYLLGYMAKNHFTHDAAKWQEEYDKAAGTIKSPVAASDVSLAEGKRIYEINCKVCHGEKGDGNGQIVELPDGTDGPYTARPPKYSDRLKQITEGNMFYSVSYGKGQMGGYGFQLSVTERWHVINYIKKLAGVDAPAATTDVKATASN